MKVKSLILGACLLALAAGAAPASAFEITSFDGATLEADGSATVRAGAHPFEAFNRFTLSTKIDESFEFENPSTIEVPEENSKDIETSQPAGVIGNPQAVPTCHNEALLGFVPTCPTDSQVGVAELTITAGALLTARVPIYNMQAPPGTAAEFGFNLVGVPVYLTPTLRTGGDYGIDIDIHDLTEAAPMSATKIIFWGVPGDPRHTSERGYSEGGGQPCAEESTREAEPGGCEHAFTAPIRPFITQPSACSAQPLATALRINSWEHPGTTLTERFLGHDGEGNPVGVQECAALAAKFRPTVRIGRTTRRASTATGIEVGVRLPQTQDTVANAKVLYPGSGSPASLPTPALHTAIVTLPAGMTINPAVANGLGACTTAQVALDSAAPSNCPRSSQLGVAEIDSPLFDHTISGGVFLAEQSKNKFGSLLAAYAVIDDPATGTVVKLPGRVDLDPANGQVHAVFADNPQLPFSEFRLRLFGGDDAALLEPEACGQFQADAEFSPWSAQNPDSPSSADVVRSSDSFTVDRGSEAGACAGPAFTPSFEAGSSNTAAGAFSPFAIKLGREEGSQRLAGLSARLPAGLLAKLAGVPFCPDGTIAAISAAEGTGAAEAAASACPAASQVGTVAAAVGAGTPFFVNGGRAFLAGPYKGAPLSVAFVVPALAGPFDLGNVVVRAALQVNPANAQVTVVSDPIPQLLHGIPLDIRRLTVDVDRSNFTVNPTSCDPTAVGATASSAQGASAALSQRFQVGGCAGLGFRPSISLRLSGQTRRTGFPALTATVNYPSGGAYSAIERASVLLPHSEFLEQSHLVKPCNMTQFAAGACPPSTVYGKATVFSPLLDKPLEGPVILRTSGRRLPDLVAHLGGEIPIDLVGHIDSVHGGIRTTFEGVPDAPVSKFVLALKGGRKGLLVNSTSACGVHRASVQLDAHNGKTADSNPALLANCPKPRKGKGGKR